MFHTKTQYVVDTLILGALPLGALVDMLPPTAAAVSIIYGIIKIIETETFLKELKSFKERVARINSSLLKSVEKIKSLFSRLR